ESPPPPSQAPSLGMRPPPPPSSAHSLILCPLLCCPVHLVLWQLLCRLPCIPRCWGASWHTWPGSRQLWMAAVAAAPLAWWASSWVAAAPLAWWRLHGDFAPELQTVAQRVLCIPATAAANERVFSAFSHVWSDKRASLILGRMWVMAYIYFNKRVLERKPKTLSHADWEEYEMWMRKTPQDQSLDQEVLEGIWRNTHVSGARYKGATWGRHLLNRQLSTEVRTSLTRFRLGNSGLGVEKARFEGVTFIDRTCTRCTEGVVDDAMHFIFECTATSSIREQPEFALTLQNNNENLHDFMLSPCAPLFVHLAMKCVSESPEPLEGEGGLAA
ncbi:hypothetical protein QJQ45_015139, partial [Haematococcus lacustris]